jgi:flavin reductase (DIM6/NTAB) family NADH-FMN oxidoreductase RutF
MKKPWNIIDAPVYSLATFANGVLNMNICTYVSAVSMKPKRYMVAVYHNTKTLEQLQSTDFAILQLLHTSQSKLVRTLGQKSGFDYDKAKYLNKTHQLCEWQGMPVLADACALISLKKMEVQTAGDHDMYLFDVIAYKTLKEDVLSINHLREKKLIRI